MNQQEMIDAVVNSLKNSYLLADDPGDYLAAALDVIEDLGLHIDVKRPIVFGYDEYQQWLPGSKRLITDWVEDEVVCRHCDVRIWKFHGHPWADAAGNPLCETPGSQFLDDNHEPKRS